MIIDSHVHFGSSIDFDMRKELVLEAMEKYNIDKIIVSNCEAVECDHDQNRLEVLRQVPQIVCAERTVSFARENPEKVYAAIWVKPLQETPDTRLRLLIKSSVDVIKAIKVHPFFSAVPFDDKRVEEYVEIAADYEIPVIVHTGNSFCDNVDRVYQMAKKFPEVKFIMAHLGLGTDNQRALELIKNLPNLYGDTAWVPMMTTIQFVNQIGSERLLFGSDMPIDGLDTYKTNKTGQRSLYQDYFYELEKYISKEAYENIMYKNAMRLFGL